MACGKLLARLLVRLQEIVEPRGIQSFSLFRREVIVEAATRAFCVASSPALYSLIDHGYIIVVDGVPQGLVSRFRCVSARFLPEKLS